MREPTGAIRSLALTALLLLLSHRAFAVPTAVVTLDTPQAINTGPLFATISIQDPITGTFGTATAAPGQLQAEIIGKSGAVATALATFEDSLILAGPGTTAKLQFTEVLNGTLNVDVAGGQAKVLAALSVSGPGFLGAQAQYQKTQQFQLAPIESGSLQLIVDVPIGTLDLLTQLNTNATGNAALPSTSDYDATDHIYITSLTPGVTITSLSNHDYALVPEPSSVAALCFGLGILALAAWQGRVSGEAIGRQ